MHLYMKSFVFPLDGLYFSHWMEFVRRLIGSNWIAFMKQYGISAHLRDTAPESLWKPVGQRSGNRTREYSEWGIREYSRIWHSILDALQVLPGDPPATTPKPFKTATEGREAVSSLYFAKFGCCGGGSPNILEGGI